ncbi:Haloacid dehalogenase-like hydrolase domain-containing protein [Porphyridium purpureum]|uniref:Haloacid dehalogenase-like hydrolase domain-containing protein n=1 Tax=Porphyridium purpureum TaxID=35688 RepID=A0A5J4YM40_PORPP|nr:Haloacid dehalogenase-like hydrolase domain-containing protein [Porphyridium purpureum]|eukprot:POR4705..scf295_9
MLISSASVATELNGLISSVIGQRFDVEIKALNMHVLFIPFTEPGVSPLSMPPPTSWVLTASYMSFSSVCCDRGHLSHREARELANSGDRTQADVNSRAQEKFTREHEPEARQRSGRWPISLVGVEFDNMTVGEGLCYIGTSAGIGCATEQAGSRYSTWRCERSHGRAASSHTLKRSRASVNGLAAVRVGAQPRGHTPAVCMCAGLDGRSGGSLSSARALIFDCDGVILESESLHREAYNQVFREFNIAYEWSEEYYDGLQNKVGGGKPKMRYYFNKYGWPDSSLFPAPQDDEEAQTRLVDELQDRKTEIYKEFIATGVAKQRPGILRLMDEAIAAKQRLNLKLAICSASTKSSCLFTLDNLVGPERLKHFDVILAGDDVPQKKPDPMIYNVCLERLSSAGGGVRIDRAQCLVVEDSKIGLQAAKDAGMKCIITYTPSTASQDMSDADAVIPNLGECNGSGDPVVTLDMLFPESADQPLLATFHAQYKKLAPL